MQRCSFHWASGSQPFYYHALFRNLSFHPRTPSVCEWKSLPYFKENYEHVLGLSIGFECHIIIKLLIIRPCSRWSNTKYTYENTFSFKVLAPPLELLTPSRLIKKDSFKLMSFSYSDQQSIHFIVKCSYSCHHYLVVKYLSKMIII